MNKKQFILWVAFTIIFAFLGGALSVQVFFGKALFGQVQEIGEFNIVKAREFRLVNDTRERILGAFKIIYKSEPSVILYLNDRNGIQRIQLIVDVDGNPSAHFWNKEAKNVIFPTIKNPSISFWDDSDKLLARVPTIK